ncbi:MAG: glycosyltransferase [Tepidisphaeraceae bacterium]|jgi:glycosyltransferase involved in cell wall biosynthesis
MLIAYLVNQYPHTSHTFIRREILALETAGVSVFRVSLRRPPVQLVDPDDMVEQRKTVVLLDAPFKVLLMAIRWAFKHPLEVITSFGLALRVGWRSYRGLPHHLIYFVEALALAWLLSQQGIEHVHAHFGTNSSTVAMLCHAAGGPAFSFTVHGPDEFDAPRGWSLGQKVERAEFVVGISEFTRSQLYRWCSYEQWPKVRVVHCGVDDLFAAMPADSIPPGSRLVCIGRLGEQKGQAILIRAVRELARQGMALELTLVGDGPLRGELQTLTRRLGVEKNVHFAGWRSGQQVREHLLSSRAMVLPSFAEGLPVVIMEALALGRPVVSTSIAGIPELVQPGVNGWLVPAGSVDALAEAMREVLHTPVERLTEMGLAGRQRVLEMHNASREAAKLAELFRRAVGEPRGVAANACQPATPAGAGDPTK